MIQTLIVEDDPLSVEILKDFIEESNLNLVVMDHCSTVKVAVSKINKLKPQLVLLDVELADGSGFDVLKAIGTINFEIIVITSHDRYAMQAVKYSALDYLIKPLKQLDLNTALRKVQRRFNDQEPRKASHGSTGFAQKLALPTFDGLLFVPADTIIRIESDGNYSDFHLTEKKKVLVTKSLKEYEKLLSPQGFIRVHHSHMINMNHLMKYVKGDGGYVIMSDMSKVDVSRRKKESFMEQLSRA